MIFQTCSLQLEVLASDQKSFEEETNASLINGVSSLENLMVSTKDTLERGIFEICFQNIKVNHRLIVYEGIHAVARNALEGHAELSGSIVSMKDTSSALLQQSKESALTFVQKSKKEIDALSITREDLRTNNAAAMTKLIDKIHGHGLKADTFTGETHKRQKYVYVLIDGNGVSY